MIKNKIFNLLGIGFFLVLSGCASNNALFNYSYSSKVLLLGTSQNKMAINLTKPVYNNYSAANCVRRSYTLKDDNEYFGRLFMDYVELNSSCSWTGLPSGFFEYNLKTKLKFKSFEKVEDIDINSHNFKTFKVNGDSYLSIIYVYGGFGDKLILDYEGKLYTQLLKKFKADYENKNLNKKRFVGNYNDSLARMSLINNYFEREEREIILPLNK